MRDTMLWIRPDSIGDAVLSASMLHPIALKFKNFKIHVICQNFLKDFYEQCPHVDKIISFEKEKLLNDDTYRKHIIDKLLKNNYALSVNSVRSPDAITFFLQDYNGAKKKIDFWSLFIGNCYVKNFGSPRLELESHQDFLEALGCRGDSLRPTIWIPNESVSFANELFKKNNLEPSRTVVLAAGVQFSPRLYGGYCHALQSLAEEEDISVIVVGTERDRPIINDNLKNFKGKVINIVGKSSILETAAIIKKSRLLVGGDSSAAHIACAVETPNAIVLGGGHYRRFFPYSKWTYCAVLYLDCFGCDWACKYNKPYCIQNVSPRTLESAIKNAWKLKGDQITFQESL